LSFAGKKKRREQKNVQTKGSRQKQG